MWKNLQARDPKLCGWSWGILYHKVDDDDDDDDEEDCGAEEDDDEDEDDNAKMS